MYSAEEQTVLDYLKSSPNAFFSVVEICRRAGDKEKWAQNRRWALPILGRLLDRGLVETDASGHYRLARREPS